MKRSDNFPKLSDLLWVAANKYLTTAGKRFMAGTDLRERYMCGAISEATLCLVGAYRRNPFAYERRPSHILKLEGQAFEALRNIGVRTQSMWCFYRGKRVENWQEQQQIRYSILMWLHDEAIKQGL